MMMILICISWTIMKSKILCVDALYIGSVCLEGVIGMIRRYVCLGHAYTHITKI